MNTKEIPGLKHVVITSTCTTYDGINRFEPGIEKKMNSRGGKRIGSGRPFADKERVTIYVKREVIAIWRSLKGHFTLGEFLEKLFGKIERKK